MTDYFTRRPRQPDVATDPDGNVRDRNTEEERLQYLELVKDELEWLKSRPVAEDAAVVQDSKSMDSRTVQFPPVCSSEGPCQDVSAVTGATGHGATVRGDVQPPNLGVVSEKTIDY